MQDIQEICVDLGSFGDRLGTLSPTFGLKANSDLPAPAASKLLDELSALGDMLAGLNPREVSIWGA